MRIASLFFVSSLTVGAVFCPALHSAWAQDNAADVSAGHSLATKVCAVCHVAAPDQRTQPMLQPPAVPFATIMQRPDVTAGSLRTFMATTHRGLDKPNGMPDPDLADYQVKQVVAYLLSLRK